MHLKVDWFCVLGHTLALSSMPKTDHSTCIGDNSPSFPRYTYVSRTWIMQTSLLIDDNELMPLKCPKIPGTFKLLFFIF